VDPYWFAADLDDEGQMARLSRWVGAWEPCFSISRPPRDALLYEPDGTLYAVAAGAPMTFRLNHRERAVAAGDALVIPQGLALDVEPRVELLAVTCTGTEPDHFRERFIQVWGFDHFPGCGREAGGGTASWVQVIPADDPRYHVSMALAVLSEGCGPLQAPPSLHCLTLVLGLEGELGVSLAAGPGPAEIPPGRLLGLAPGGALELVGSGRAAVIRLLSEPAFHARRVLGGLRPGAGPRPEASPRRHNPADPDCRPGIAGRTDHLPG
jgi:hypothetical protein